MIQNATSSHDNLVLRQPESPPVPLARSAVNGCVLMHDAAPTSGGLPGGLAALYRR